LKYKIKDLCKLITSGGTPSRKQQEKYFSYGTINWVKTQELQDGNLYETEEKITEVALKESSAKLLPRNTVSMAMYGATVGKLGILKKEMATNQACCNMVVEETKADYHFLYYSLLYNRSKIIGLANGAAQQNLNLSVIGEFEIDWYTLEEQRQISATLSALDAKIELNNAINKNLEEMAQALFKRWFVDFEFPNEIGEPYKSSGGEFEESELGLIPKGWKLAQLEEIIEINPKRILKKGEYSPYVEMKNLRNNYARVSEYVLREFSSGSKFSNGDVLLARITPCLENGKTAYVDFLKDNEVGWGSTEFLILRSRSGIPPEFTYFLARSDQFRSYAILSMTGSSGRQRVPESSLKNYMVPLPQNLNLISVFGEIAKSALTLMKKNDDENEILSKIRDTLLPKLMSGEIRVPVEQDHNDPDLPMVAESRAIYQP